MYSLRTLWQIKAFALNRMDITQREGNYPWIPPGSSEILGVEFSGHIAALGPNTSLGWQTGDEVLGLANGVSIRFIHSQKPDISAHVRPVFCRDRAHMRNLSRCLKPKFFTNHHSCRGQMQRAFLRRSSRVRLPIRCLSSLY